MEKNYGDLITGTLLLALSILMFVATLNIGVLTDSKIGADFMPKVIAILIAIMSVPVIVNGFKVKKKSKKYEKSIVSEDEGASVSEEVKEGTNHKADYVSLILTIILLFVYLSLIPVLGFLIATSGYLIMQMLFFSEWTIKNTIRYAIISIVTSTIVYFVFRNAFYVMLPAGILG